MPTAMVVAVVTLFGVSVILMDSKMGWSGREYTFIPLTASGGPTVAEVALRQKKSAKKKNHRHY